MFIHILGIPSPLTPQGSILKTNFDINCIKIYVSQGDIQLIECILDVIYVAEKVDKFQTKMRAISLILWYKILENLVTFMPKFAL